MIADWIKGAIGRNRQRGAIRMGFVSKAIYVNFDGFFPSRTGKVPFYDLSISLNFGRDMRYSGDLCRAKQPLVEQVDSF